MRDSLCGDNRRPARSAQLETIPERDAMVERVLGQGRVRAREVESGFSELGSEPGSSGVELRKRLGRYANRHQPERRARVG